MRPPTPHSPLERSRIGGARARAGPGAEPSQAGGGPPARRVDVRDDPRLRRLDPKVPELGTIGLGREALLDELPGLLAGVDELVSERNAHREGGPPRSRKTVEIGELPQPIGPLAPPH